MNCKTAREKIDRFLDHELPEKEGKELEEHLRNCFSCQEEKQKAKKLHELIRALLTKIEPSNNFENSFWQKVTEREKAHPPLLPLFFPTLSQAIALLLIAFLIGGTGGILTTANQKKQEPKITPASLSRFPEYKGLPAASMTAIYLKERNI